MAHVLVADPEDGTRELIERLVERLGHRVVSGCSLRLAGNPSPSEPPVDLVIYEPGPLGDGPPPADPRREHPGAALLVASIYPCTRADTGLDPDACLAKPFSLSEFSQAVSRALHRHRAGAAAEPQHATG